MKYALLIYGAEPTEAVPEDVMSAEMDGYQRFGQHITDRGANLGGEALQSTATATTVRVQDGRGGMRFMASRSPR